MQSLFPIGPLVAVASLVFIASALGVAPIKKLIQVKEAKHELKHGSPGFIRSMSGWIIIAIWLAATWFLASIIGDWWAFGDLGAAVERSLARLELLLQILAALSDD